jgi:Binding-prot-dependent transport system membrane comp, N-term
MAWVAVDRAIKAVELMSHDGPVDRWRALRNELHDEVCREGYDGERDSFVQFYGADHLDASLLQIPLVGDLRAAADPAQRRRPAGRGVRPGHRAPAGQLPPGLLPCRPRQHGQLPVRGPDAALGPPQGLTLAAAARHFPLDFRAPGVYDVRGKPSRGGAMLTFIARRLLVSIPVLLLSSVLVFLMVANSGDPLSELKERNPPVPEQVLEARRSQLHLDRPLPERYWHWIRSFVRGDMGESIRGLDVRSELGRRMTVTLRMVVLAIVLAILLAIGSGVLSAVRQYTVTD